MRDPRAARWGAAVVGLWSLTACATADLLAPGHVVTTAAEAAGRQWLAAAADAQGGAALGAHRTVSLWMRDTWPGWLSRAVAMPWPEDGQRFRLDAVVGTDDARITFIGGPEAGHAWGIQRWVADGVAPGEAARFDPVDDPDDDVKFWIPTTLYFPFLAWRLQEASVVQLLAPEDIDGRRYQRIFATWGQAAPQDEVDQYVLYVDDETHLVRWARYTVRDVAGFAVGLMRLEDYQPIGDVRLAASMTVVSAYTDEEPSLHRYQVERGALDAPLPGGPLVPRPDLTSSK